MGMKHYIRRFISAIFKRYNYEVIDARRLYDWQKDPEARRTSTETSLPGAASDHLHWGNARLLDLQARYNAFDPEVTTPVIWTDSHVHRDDILRFRGDNAYVWQLRGPNMNVLAYALTHYYVKSIDTLKLLDSLDEDNLFGNVTFTVDHRTISRDLLDSILEIYFLEKHLRISTLQNVKVLDIGAGYGRLAHRMVRALPNVHSYFCTDAIAVSSFLSEYYLQVRALAGRARMVPLDEIRAVLEAQEVQVAVNIHSFSECSIAAIEWWLSLISKHKVRYLMIVPNSAMHNGERLLTLHGDDFGASIEKFGYALRAKEPKYRDPVVQDYAINPTYHYLFELQTPVAASGD